MGRQHVQRAGPHLDRHIPVRLRREREPVEHLGRVVGAAVRGGREQRARQVPPAETPEGPHPFDVDRVAGQQEHPVLAGEMPVSPGVVGSVEGAVPVEVETRRHSGVHRPEEAVVVAQGFRAELGDRQVVADEGGGCRTVGVVVELGEQHDVGANALQHLGHQPCLLAARGVGQFGGHPALDGAGQRGVEGGHPDRAGGRWCGHAEAARSDPGRVPTGGAGGPAGRRRRGGGGVAGRATGGRVGGGGPHASSIVPARHRRRSTPPAW